MGASDLAGHVAIDDRRRGASSFRRARGRVAAAIARRSFRIAAAAVGIAGAPLALASAVSSGGASAVDTAAVLSVLVSWSFVVSGFVAWDRDPANRTGAMLLALGLWWTVGSLLGPPTTSSSLLYTLGVVSWLAWAAAFVYVLLAFPLGRLATRVDRVLVAVVFLTSVPMQIAWLLFVERELFLDGSPANAFLVWANEDVATGIDAAQRILFLGAALALVTVVGGRWIRASVPLRRTLTPVLVGAVAVLVLWLFVIVEKFWRVPPLLRWSLLVAYAAVPITLLVSMLRTRLARSSLADLVLALSANLSPAELRDALADALRDRSLEVAYYVPGAGRYVDAEGRAVELPLSDPARATTLVERHGRTIAALVHDIALRDDPALVESVCAAAALALENQRLQAELRARLEELRASRARIVEAADGERRRIERNLHDGTQQRLVSIAMELGLAESKLGGTAEARAIVAGARHDLLAALEELRELGRGIHPGVLTERGLTRALKELAYRAPVPLDLDVRLERRLPPQVEVAAYFVVCEALANVAKHARATAASVRIEQRDGRAVVEIADDGVGGADPSGSGLRGLADRAEALGGRLSLVSPPGAGSVLRVEIPCA